LYGGARPSLFTLSEQANTKITLITFFETYNDLERWILPRLPLPQLRGIATPVRTPYREMMVVLLIRKTLNETSRQVGQDVNNAMMMNGKASVPV